MAAARSISAQAATTVWQQAADGQIAVLGLLIPEEVRQGEFEQNWLFLVRHRSAAASGSPVKDYLVPGDRLSVHALQERTPALAGTRTRTVALAGLGAIGGGLAMELARAQVGRLRLLDADYVEAGNTVRWPFGLTAVGTAKSVCLANRIQADYPFTEAQAFHHLIGEALPPGGLRAPGDATVLSAFLDGADLVVDATAELGVSQLLADLAAAAHIPLLSVWGTEGGWGGAVAELAPGAGGCWYCLQLRLADGSIPMPPAEPNSYIQPRGCSAPTFSATSFDMLEIVAQTMRAARRNLVGTAATAIVHVCSVRDGHGSELPAPVWTSHPLQVHPDCRCCCDVAQAA
jgi:hypothetical protein